MSLFIPITKVDAAKRLVYGTLTEETPDKSDEIFDYATGKKAIQDWSDEISKSTNGKSKGNVRAMHDSIAAGKFTDISFDDDNKRVEGVAKIVDDAEWEKVKEGVYTGFSIGGGYAKRWKDEKNPGITRYTPIISEVSLVDNPCVGTATFDMIKADGTKELRKFKHKEENMADSNSAVQLVEDGKPVKPANAPVQKNVWLASDSSEHPNKRAAEIYNLGLEKSAEIAPALNAMEDLLKGAKKPEEDDDADKDGDSEETKADKKKKRDDKAAKKKEDDDAAKAASDKELADKAAKDETEKAAAATELAKAKEKDKEKGGDVEYADSGHQKDGKKRYPIDTEEHVRAAWNYINKKKNADKYDADALKEVKDKIVAAWKSKIDKDGPPSADNKKMMKSLNAEVMRKGLYAVSSFAQLLESVTWQVTSAFYEKACEGDDSEMPEKLKAWLKDGTVLLKEMLEEETAELFEDDDDTEAVEKSLSESSFTGGEALAKFIGENMLPLHKAESGSHDVLTKFIKVLEKAGAKHSAAHKEAMMSIHKSAGDHLEHIEKCFKAAGIMADEDEGEGKENKKMAKIIDALNSKTDELAATTTVVKTLNETMTKAVDAMKVMQKTNEELGTRIEILEKQPAAAKGYVRSVSKGEDSGQVLADELAKMKPEERVNALMKAALANPVEAIQKH